MPVCEEAEQVYLICKASEEALNNWTDFCHSQGQRNHDPFVFRYPFFATSLKPLIARRTRRPATGHGAQPEGADSRSTPILNSVVTVAASVTRDVTMEADARKHLGDVMDEDPHILLSG